MPRFLWLFSLVFTVKLSLLVSLQEVMIERVKFGTHFQEKNYLLLKVTGMLFMPLLSIILLGEYTQQLHEWLVLSQRKTLYSM